MILTGILGPQKKNGGITMSVNAAR